MSRYDMGRGNGLAALDVALNTPDPKTDKPFNCTHALDEVFRIAREVGALTHMEMQNVPPPVRNSIELLVMAVGELAAVLRSRVVTEPYEG